MAAFLWKDGIIQFNRANWGEMTSYLERWYGVKFKIEGNKSENLEYTGTFDNKSLEKVLIGLSFSLHFEHEIKDKQVHIQFDEF